MSVSIHDSRSWVQSKSSNRQFQRTQIETDGKRGRSASRSTSRSRGLAHRHRSRGASSTGSSSSRSCRYDVQSPDTHARRLGELPTSGSRRHDRPEDVPAADLNGTSGRVSTSGTHMVLQGHRLEKYHEVGRSSEGQVITGARIRQFDLESSASASSDLDTDAAYEFTHGGVGY